MTPQPVKKVKKRWSELTDHQHSYVVFIIEWRKANGFSPTLSELAQAFGVKDGTAQTIVNRIIAKGYMKKTSQQRSLKPTAKYLTTYGR